MVRQSIIKKKVSKKEEEHENEKETHTTTSDIEKNEEKENDIILVNKKKRSHGNIIDKKRLAKQTLTRKKVCVQSKNETINEEDDKKTEKITKVPSSEEKNASLPWSHNIQSHPNHFVIAFWNLNGIRAVLKNNTHFNGKSPLHEYVDIEKPDILCLNETKIHESQCDEFKDILPEYIGYFACSEKKGYAGVGIFVKKGLNAKIESTGLGSKLHDGEGRVQTLLINSPRISTPFYLVNTYVVNAGRGLPRLPYKIDNFNKDLYAYLNELKKKHPVIWCGDLNVAHQEIDIWNSKGNQKSAGHTPEERKSFGDFLNNDNWIDIFRHLYPNRIQYTYWSPMVKTNYENNKGWRLDYFVIPKESIMMCEDVLTRKDVRGSDHCPIVLLINTKESSNHKNELNKETITFGEKTI